MTPIRKTLFGYSTSSVKRSIRNYQRICQQEIMDLEEKIAIAHIKRNALQAEWSALAPLPIADVRTHSEEKSGAVELDEIADDYVVEVVISDVEIEEFEVDTVMEEVAVAVELESYSAPMDLEEQREKPIAEIEAEAVHTQEIKPSNVIYFKRKQDVSLSISNFWGDLEAYLSPPEIPNVPPMNSELILAALPQVDSVANNGLLPKYFNYSVDELMISKSSMSPSVNKRRLNKPIDESKTSLESRTAPTILAASAGEAPSDKPIDVRPSGNGSNEITREIRQLRYRYIVGKSAGEDLLNNRKELIIAKNQPITEAVVDEAEREGLLALLIVHMTIPGLGEDA